MNGQLRRGFNHSSLKKELQSIFVTVSEEKKGVGKLMTHIRTPQKSNSKKGDGKNG
jgi:hypothetical protein